VAAAGPADQEVAGAGGIGLSPIRDRRRKTVVLVDDDPETRQAAVAELEHGDVPVRAFDDGNAALTAIAEEKPDVIVLEVGMGGDMGGKDLVNFVKATMEWVDIPIILWTREPIASQKEARQIHGADEVVPKSGGAAALLARVITVFRRA
jgi:two-component system KDP operon response regulator KdpE